MAGPHQTAGLFGEQAVAAGIRRIHQPDRPPQEVRGDVGRCRRRLPGRPGQPRDGLGVACARTAGQVLGDQQGWSVRVGQPLPGLVMQCLTDAAGQVLVDGIADQVVTKSQVGAVVSQDSCSDRLRQRGGQAEHRSVGDRGQVDQRKRRSQDRGGLQCLQGVVGQEAKPAQDRQAQGRREGRLGDLGPPPRGRDRALLEERPEQFGDEQRVAGRSRDLREQP